MIRRLVFVLAALLPSMASAQGASQIFKPGGSGGSAPTPAQISGALQCTDSVGTDAWACSPTNCNTTLDATTPFILVTVGTANTGGATYALCGGTAKAVVRPVTASISTALVTGDVLAGQKILLGYSVGNDNWQMTTVSAKQVDTTITAGTTATSGCTDGGFLYSLTSLIRCGANAINDGTTITMGPLVVRTTDYASGSTVPLTVQGSLTGNWQEWKNSAGTLFHTVGSGGALFSSATGNIFALYNTTNASNRFQFYGGVASPDGWESVVKIHAGAAGLSTGIASYATTEALQANSSWFSLSMNGGAPYNFVGGANTLALVSGEIGSGTLRPISIGGYTGGAYTEWLGLAITGKATFGGIAHVGGSGTAPALSSCGSSPTTVTGNDFHGVFTTGSGGTVQSCTGTFATAYTAAPSCFANTETSILALRVTTTTTTFVIDSAVAGTLASQVIKYGCIGN